ncbi:1-(5-phosphoribosyl)-5-[(5-phosphoribosylamino)methylideneamino] imidazole-4-carboxamide isomerase [Dethiosulfatibacter aminovorans DSM 17477]|uniref:1-(5-phosphoribosyl)-5-[(5-phosphoribosylamino)methylideneamino] imidazole-4-carboxamide isomerase n=1 Tax=Dethiosulfatibacter aminovorans DSM 17477 TaxID=1121476 RepID=A0A1M6I9E8_9FIRM|nr:phosphoribosylformimino-5-aminoimidazole carboxamide ribotide isomerase [Dethiosulfatibacter aminovorans]SHJ31070.1 1-(5-phosphoribosyl)-5-[(5-phosphoribosylamino)methylideneamino] imidazole-4-carboxamide isomerase [Dethiosulfatibacter aminovorans DSM 17477]
MEFRPCIDLHEGKVKQIVGGSLNDSGAEENFVSQRDAGYYAELYREAGLRGGHVIALGPGNQEQIEKALAAYPGGLQVGGGINADNAKWYIDKGASHVIVTSFIFKDGEFFLENLKEIRKVIRKENLVIDLSCRKKDGKYYVVTNRWQKFTNFEVNEENMDFLSEFCDEFLVHAVDVEGLKSGIDEDLIKKLSRWVKIPCTYAGGISSIEDVKLIEKMSGGRMNYTIGSALDIFGGDIKFEDVIKL